LVAAASLGEFAAAGHYRLLELADLLWRTGFLEDASREEEPGRSSWEFHDLLFHWRSRGGRVSGPQAGTYRFLGRWDSPPAVKPRMSGDSVPLPKPDPDESGGSKGGLAAVVERRRSRRGQGERPVSLAQVGRLLHQVARVQQRLPGEHQEMLLRPVPAAGAIHELELYLIVGRCDGLAPGLYHYHAERHTADRLASEERHVLALLRDAAEAWAKPEEPPQVLIVITSRLPRLAWKYEGLAYRLTLLNAGAMIEALYLSATEMGLACCALGGGDSSLFASATALDPFAETSVAEFAVGSLRRGG
jgi:SagB-type dehydrogenase family enzyme